MSASKSRHDDIVQISIDAWVSCFAAASRKRIAAIPKEIGSEQPLQRYNRA